MSPCLRAYSAPRVNTLVSVASTSASKARSYCFKVLNGSPRICFLIACTGTTPIPAGPTAGVVFKKAGSTVVCAAYIHLLFNCITMFSLIASIKIGNIVSVSKVCLCYGFPGAFTWRPWIRDFNKLIVWLYSSSVRRFLAYSSERITDTSMVSGISSKSHAFTIRYVR